MAYMKRYEEFVIEDLDKKLKEKGYAGFEIENCPLRDSIWLTLFIDNKQRFRREISMKDFNTMIIYKPETIWPFVENMIHDWERRKND